MRRSVISSCLSEIHHLDGRQYWRGWEQNLHTRSISRGNGRVASRVVEVDFSRFTPEDYLLSWFTAVAGVEDEPDGHTIVTPHNKFINDNGNAWSNTVLLESYHSFILAENFSEHISVQEFSKGKVLDAVAWVVEHQFNGYREPVPTVFVDCLIATHKKKHPRLVSKLLRGVINTSSMGCLLPDGEITLIDGTRRPIRDILEGDYVLDGLGQLGRVKRVLTREVKNEPVYHGDVVGIRDGFTLTGEHPLYLLRGHKKQIQEGQSSPLNLPHACDGPSISPAYYRVDSLGNYRAGDRHTPQYYVQEVYPRDVWLPSETVTEEGVEFLGMLAGNGLLESEENSESSTDVELYLNKASGCPIDQRGKGLTQASCGSYRVYTHRENRSEFFHKFLLGRTDAEKKFTAEVIHWPHHLQRSLIRGYFNTNGEVYGKTLQLKAESRSRDLADQIYLILLRLGILANKGDTIYKPTGYKFGDDTYRIYTVTVSSSWNESWMCDKLPVSKRASLLNGQSFFNGDKLNRPIRGTNQFLYTGPVYNLEIEGDPSYLHNNIRLHNCDVLYTQCSRCGRVTEEGVDEACQHIQDQLGRYYTDKEGKRRRVAEKCGVKGKKGSCVFKELSLVSKPAFLWAKLHGFLDYSHDSTGRPLKAFVPYNRYRESNKDV